MASSDAPHQGASMDAAKNLSIDRGPHPFRVARLRIWHVGGALREQPSTIDGITARARRIMIIISLGPMELDTGQVSAHWN